MDIIKEYLLNTNFHGLRFIAESGRHWIERLFWLICVCASWVLCYILIMNSWWGFQNNSLSFGTETDYMNWNTSFFSVSVCEHKNKERLYKVHEKYLGKGDDIDFNLGEALTDISYFQGDHYFLRTLCSGSKANPNCPKENLKKFSEESRSSCEETLSKCSWNGQPFDCCSHFLPLETEKGVCFSINSLQTHKKNPFPLISNRVTGPGTLHLEILVPAMVYVHSAEDVPNANSVTSEVIQAQTNLVTKRIYALTEIVNDPLVQYVEVDKRRCRFPDENTVDIYKYYSYSSCLVDCRIQKQLAICNCTSHLSPGVDSSKLCNLTGLICLTENPSKYTVLVNTWADKEGLRCDCLPGCGEPEFEMVEQHETGVQLGHAVVEIALLKLPSLRLKRQVVRDQLDLVVSMGGSAGLFVGASLLSFVEFFYFFTIRFCWNRYIKYLENKPQRKESEQAAF